MILPFMKKFPWGEGTFFKEKILACEPEHHRIMFGSNGEEAMKLHTIRNGQRWKPGNRIHMAYGVRSKQYEQFNKDREDLQTVVSVQRFDLVIRPWCKMIFVDRQFKYLIRTDLPFDEERGGPWLYQFSKNDGFDTIDQFWKWFKHPIRNGQIIHWTDLKY